MKYLILIIITLLYVTLFSCKTYTPPVLTSGNKSQFDNASEGFDKKSYANGRALAMTECASCHRFYYPRKYSPDQWKDIISKKEQRLSLREEQVTDIKFYLLTESKSTHNNEQ